MPWLNRLLAFLFVFRLLFVAFAFAAFAVAAFAFLLMDY